MSDYDTVFEAIQRLEKKHGHFVMHLPFSRVVAIIGQLQFALRHPGNRGLPAEVVRQTVDNILLCLETEEPELARLLRQGDDPRYDVPFET